MKKLLILVLLLVLLLTFVVPAGAYPGAGNTGSDPSFCPPGQETISGCAPGWAPGTGTGGNN